MPCSGGDICFLYSETDGGGHGDRRSRRPCRTARRAPGSATDNAAIETLATPDTDIEPAPFARRVLREGERHVILGDGAPWVWNFADEHFPDATQIVDIVHAKDHLFEVAKAIYGSSSQWARKRREELDEGRVDEVCRPARPCRHL